MKERPDAEDSRLRLDQAFKNTLEGPHVLALFLCLIREFEGLSYKEMESCMELSTDGRTMRHETELQSLDGPVYVDNLFEVRKPTDGRKAKVFIDGQAYIGKRERLYMRMLYYANRIMDKQKAQCIEGSMFENLPDVYGICVVFNSPEWLRNRIIRKGFHGFEGSDDIKGFDRVPLNLTMAFLGEAGDQSEPLLVGHNLIYAKGMPMEERENWLKKFNIPSEGLLNRSVREMMDLASGYILMGRIEGAKEEKKRLMEDFIDVISSAIVKSVKYEGKTVEEATDLIYPAGEFSSEVEEAVRRKLASQNRWPAKFISAG